MAGSQADMNEIHREVRRRFAAEITVGVVRVHRARSADVASRLEDCSLDWAYVDGDHGYAAVIDDLRRYWPKLRPEGHLCGDDYSIVDRWWGDGVRRAVDEFAAREDAAPEVRLDQWDLVKPQG